MSAKQVKTIKRLASEIEAMRLYATEQYKALNALADFAFTVAPYSS